MSKRLSFVVNDLFKEHKNLDNFWVALYQKFKMHGFHEGWPLIQRAEHVIDELRNFFEHNGIYDLLRKDEEIIEVVLQERTPYSGTTFKLADDLKVMVPKSSWFIQRAPKARPGYYLAENSWVEYNTLQNVRVFAYPNKDGEGQLWTDTYQPNGVNIVERLKITSRDLTPSPVKF